MMETPLAILNAAAIAAAGVGGYPLTVFIMGTNDLAKETRASLSGGRLGMLAWLSTCVAAGRANGIDIIDGVVQRNRRRKRLGGRIKSGPAARHGRQDFDPPSQIERATPPSARRRRGGMGAQDHRRLELKENAGKGVISLEGRMVELLHAADRQATVAIADMIADREAAH